MGMFYFWLFVFLTKASSLVESCDCSFDSSNGELTCNDGTQVGLPFTLPPCVNTNEHDVLRLLLMHQNFDRIVFDAFKDFPNLEYLDLSNCGISSVDQDAFTSNINLKTLTLSHNELETLPRLFPSSNNKLMSLIVRDNYLIALESAWLEKLYLLDLNNNELNQESLRASLKSPNLPNLVDLRADENQITSLDKTLFQEQHNLEYLSLWNNMIDSIQPGTFDHLLKLKSVDLKVNSFSELGTESWHFCHTLGKQTLNLKVDDGVKLIQDLKIDPFTQEYCENNKEASGGVPDSCKNSDGHLTCSGRMEDIVCALLKVDFKTVTFKFPKDEQETKIENFFEAENNEFFQDMNRLEGQSNITKYLADLKLYGTKFDLTTLEDHVGPRTEHVTIFADSIFMSNPLKEPLKYKVSIKARVVSLSHDIWMNMTKKQMLKPLTADQQVDNWAMVEEVIEGVGNVTFIVQKLGYLEIQRPLDLNSKVSMDSICSPRTFNVMEYKEEHNTPPSVFFDQVHLNLMRMAVRTLASTKSNNILAIDVADHSIMKTIDPSIVEDKNAYIVAQKLIKDKDIVLSQRYNVPFYTTKTMGDLAKVMFDKMNVYRLDEEMLLSNLSMALGRMTDMNQHFEDAKRQRQLYFERELETLEEIWNSTDSSWHWSFENSRNMEDSIQGSIQAAQEQMFEMQKNELVEMLQRTKDTVKMDKEIVQKYKDEIERYSEQTGMSLKLQRDLLEETNDMGDRVEKEKEEFNEAVEEWKEEQIRKAFFGFFKALLGVVVGIATFQPEIAGAAIAEGAIEAEKAGEEILDAMEALVDLIQALSELEEMLEEMIDIGNISGSLPDIDIDLSFDTAVNYRGALENAYKMKSMAAKFKDVNTLGCTTVESVGRATNYDVDPADLQQAMSMFSDRGGLLVEATVDFADTMMHLADIAGELKAAEADLAIAEEQVTRAQEMLDDLIAQHEEYINSMNERRDEYQNKTDEFAKEYDKASNATKEAFKIKIKELFARFESNFSSSNEQYIQNMNRVTEALYTKVASVKQHSMVQRSIIMNLYQDFCDGLRYFSFTECYESKNIPTMSDSFSTLLDKLSELEWDSITSAENLPTQPTLFEEELIDMIDKPVDGFNQSIGIGSSLRENGEAYFNIIDYPNNFQNKWRVRIDKINVRLLDASPTPDILPTPDGTTIEFKVYRPMDFTDRNDKSTEYRFRAKKSVCFSSYRFENDDIVNVAECGIDEEFAGTNHKTSPNGVFRIVSQDIPSDILDQVGGIRVLVGGSYMPFGKHF